MTEIKDIYSYISSRLDCAGIKSEKDLPLSRLTTFRIGGPCDLVLRPADAGELVTALGILKESGVRFTVIGRGSDLLFDDNGYRGAVVVTTEIKEMRREGNFIFAGCGCPVTSLAGYAAACGLSGLETAYGIPGSVGGGVYMNAGAYGGQLSDVLYSCTAFDTESGEERSFSASELGFSYRHSLFSDNKNLIITGACFELKPGNKDEILAAGEEYMRRRREKQPLEYPSAGSVFKRPRPDVYMGKLIEEAGLKGFSIGGARISEKHAGFIINTGDATAADVKALVRFVQDKIYSLHGFVPECEIISVPEKV